MSIGPRKAEDYKTQKTIITHKVVRRVLTFSDIEIEKNKKFTAIKFLFLKRCGYWENVSILRERGQNLFFLYFNWLV